MRGNSLHLRVIGVEGRTGGSELIHASNPSNPTSSSKSGLIIAVGVVIATLYFGRQIFIPLALALVLSFLLTPLVGWLQRIRIGRLPAALIVLVFCLDRKSTRLNSSHSSISYAVFCL